MVGTFMSGPPRVHHPVVDDGLTLNVNALYRAGALDAGAITQWQWVGRVTDPAGRGKISARIHAHPGRVLIQIGDGPELAVEVDHVPASLGGTFPLFRCPACSVRRWHLYVAAGLVCRACLDLDYRSRHIYRPARAALRATKLLRRLVDDRRIAARRRRRMLERLRWCEAQARADLVATMATIGRPTRG